MRLDDITNERFEKILLYKRPVLFTPLRIKKDAVPKDSTSMICGMMMNAPERLSRSHTTCWLITGERFFQIISCGWDR